MKPLIRFLAVFLLFAAAIAAQTTLFKDVKASSVQIVTSSANATITPSQYGLGWADNRMTIQTPVGALQFYYTGSPAEPVIYWPGRIVTTNFESVSITGSVSASLLSGGSISSSVLSVSYGDPFSDWQEGNIYAGAAGLPYVVDTDVGFSQLEPTIGVWYPQINVTAGGAVDLNRMRGRYRTAAQFRTDLAVPEVVAVPASASATGTAGQIAYDASFFYVCTAANTWKRAALATW